ncbi:hypothetical protein D3C86_1894000 [compost metagenome]
MFFDTHTPGCCEKVQIVPASVNDLIEVGQEKRIAPEFVNGLCSERQMRKDEKPEKYEDKIQGPKPQDPAHQKEPDMDFSTFSQFL